MGLTTGADRKSNFYQLEIEYDLLQHYNVLGMMEKIELTRGER
jgi:hypothetical protein